MKTKTEIDEIKSKYIKDQLMRKNKNKKLSQNYRKRCENFVLNMCETPIKVINHHTTIYDHKYRENHPEKYLGNF